jgi:putative glutamine amidotransferase
MKLIAITQRIDDIQHYQEKRDALDQRWWDLLSHCNIIPIILPNHLMLAKQMIKYIKIDGIILSGGNHSEERDELELYLIENALQQSIPLLGICHGMQMIQKYFNVTLEEIENHIAATQEITIHNELSIVNSYHRYGTKQSPSILPVWAKAHDGVVKAIKHVTYPLTGIMWHPERLVPFNTRDIQLLKDIF